ncbi:MAG: ABC transporter ATP-binding protein [Saprospiraceae bacterium]|nr:ABC transporter ATP-binding protein [Saprospiraceae bacterium]
MSLALELSHIQKSFGSTLALKRLDLQIPRGTLFGLVGLNGAGKTTLIRILLGMIQPDYGSVTILGQNIRNTKGPWSQVGYLLAGSQGYPRLTVLENLKVAARWRGGATSQHIQDTLEWVQLTREQYTLASQLSTGNMQRLGLATAMLTRPDVLILDEPINGVDPKGVLDIRQLFLRLTKEYGTTILLSSHILDELSRVADTIGVIHQGEMIQTFSRKELDAFLTPSLRLHIPDWQPALDFLQGRGYSAIHQEGSWILLHDPVLAAEPRTLIQELCLHHHTPTRVTAEHGDMTQIFLDLISPAHV